ncbi:hypothetical protein [Falsiroseomonas sp.]|uniref:hypothetical protein n=1 Tax=Falsiroseomonas sp. TaxID=2870721 RepID=UPI002734F9C5|nr:hypothetical protein [Falsiroseomonas sp.]MDP3418684.1 hypothetical protein [Falsiroseomonas sp.]
MQEKKAPPINWWAVRRVRRVASNWSPEPIHGRSTALAVPFALLVGLAKALG